ncbi:MAG: SMI1/KNR4 family protein [Pseudohongiellaceae bacterium]|nr:SMI1/KNR4 family protein [Pseudohongiellaceae bacterium]
MEDIIDLLQEANEPVPVPLELPDEDLLVVIEEELLLSLPDDLRVFLLNVSDVVYGSIEPVTVTDPASHTYLPEMAAIAWSLGMPRHLLPICESNGAYYCIDPDGGVGLWDGQMSDEDAWESIWHWCREVWLEQD